MRDELRAIHRSTSQEHGRYNGHSSRSARKEPRAGWPRMSGYSGSRSASGTGTQAATRATPRAAAGASRQGSVFFIVGVIILLIALLNITLVLRSYAQNVGQLNAVKNQEAQLIRQKADLENDIQRWSDDAYVTAQARQRLGFIYPGERSVLVKNAPKDAQPDAARKTTADTKPKLPWYTELLYSIENTDQAEKIGSEDVQSEQAAHAQTGQGMSSQNASSQNANSQTSQN
ncbi:FtsB family cell division protein [Alloscardovia macacae]|uniref:FtsB family cell division protein n=1 Tax=Alloscardovia macacae TaxID=1160091 RepID=UPI0015D7C8DD|nr:septum formation initiator family protein [Alloscardovia macacae]